MSGSTPSTGLRALTPERERLFLEAIGNGLTVAPAARLSGIGVKTVKDWLQVASEDRHTWMDGSPITSEARAQIDTFAAKFTAAVDSFQQTMLESIKHAATTINPKTGTYDWRAADTMLSKHPAYRSDWREDRRLEVEHTGVLYHELRAANDLTEDELDRQYRTLGELPPPTD